MKVQKTLCPSFFQQSDVMNVTHEYEGFTNITQIKDDENDDIIIIIKLLLLSIPIDVLLLSLIALIR